jgi:hypothetical protein
MAMDKAVCKTDCEHPSQDMSIRLAFPDPDYSTIEFLPAPSGLDVQKAAQSLGLNHYVAALNANIPYAFTIGAVTFAGMLYIRGDDGRDSYTDGAFGGAVNGGYHIDRNRAHVRLDGTGVRAHILIDFERRHAVGWIDTFGFRCCGYRNWGKCDTWYASNQVVIGSW